MCERECNLTLYQQGTEKEKHTAYQQHKTNCEMNQCVQTLLTAKQEFPFSATQCYQ